MKRANIVLGLAACSILTVIAAAEPLPLPISPCEKKVTIDETTGAELTYLTTHPARDTNLYFHEWSWLSNDAMILFYSDREKPGSLMGYLTATGELAHIATPAGEISSATAAVDKPSIYGICNGGIIELAIEIAPSENPGQTPSQVWATERVLAPAPEGMMGTLNPNSDGTLLAFGVVRKSEPKEQSIMTLNTLTQELRKVCVLPQGLEFAYHVQWNHENPFLLSFAALRPRLNVVDIRDGQVRHPYLELEGELVTHEHWWGANQLVFCGGLHPPPTEDAHVKTVDISTGQVRIIGAGSWWPSGTPEEISKYNFWHCSGSNDGRWVAADNWHGDITLFEGLIARPHLLTSGHRTYGKGDHPHVGWNREGTQVIFTSHKLGDPNVCVATIPKNLQETNKTPPWNREKQP